MDPKSLGVLDSGRLEVKELAIIVEATTPVGVVDRASGTLVTMRLTMMILHQPVAVIHPPVSHATIP